MAEIVQKLQPGAILHEVLVGALRANGDRFNGWCHRNGIAPSVMRNATFGQSRGPAGEKLLAQMIDGADKDFIERVYVRRLKERVAERVCYPSDRLRQPDARRIRWRAAGFSGEPQPSRG